MKNYTLAKYLTDFSQGRYVFVIKKIKRSKNEYGLFVKEKKSTFEKFFQNILTNYTITNPELVNGAINTYKKEWNFDGKSPYFYVPCQLENGDYIRLEIEDGSDIDESFVSEYGGDYIWKNVEKDDEEENSKVKLLKAGCVMKMPDLMSFTMEKMRKEMM